MSIRIGKRTGWRARVLGCWVVAGLGLAGGVVSAQAPETASERTEAPATALVVPASAEQDLTLVREWVTALERALRSEGVNPLPAEQARLAFEAHGSSPAVALSASDIDQWAARSQSAVRHLARADYDRARSDLLEAHALASRAAEELNREAERARQVLDTCLYMVRAYVETRDDESAMNQARACRQLVPGAEPSAYRHTPEVREIIARVDRAMAAEAPGQLVVTSAPSGCTVRLNGISFGVTPFRMDDLAAGEYRLQVECDAVERGRSRRLRVTAGETSVHVDGSFDLAVRSRPALGLVYLSSERARALAGGHARALAEQLGAREVWLVWLEQGGRVRVDRVSMERASSAYLRADLANPMQADVILRDAVRHLRAGRSVDLDDPDAPARVALELPQPGTAEDERDDTNDDSDARTATEQAPLAAARRERRRRVALGLTSSLSLAALASASGLHAARVRRGEAFARLYSLSRQQAWIDLRLPSTLLAAGGGLLATTALPPLLPEREGVPGGAWVAGALGLGLAGASVGFTLRRPDCSGFVETRRACIEREQLGDRAILVASAAAPLLSVPLVYALRPARVTPDVDISRRGAFVSLSGLF